MNKLLFVIYPFLFSFKPLPKIYRGLTKKEIAQKVDQLRMIRSSKQKRPLGTSTLMIKNNKLKREISRLKKVRNFSPSFGNEFGMISTFERFKGVIDGNIISSGQPVNFKVDFKDARKIPSDTYLSCTGTNLSTKYNYRIIAHCDRLITPEGEFKVTIGLKDLKKVDGIAPDHIYTGEEEAIVGEGFSSIMGGIIDARKERSRTAIGFKETPSLKNAYLGGLISAAKLANQKSKDHTSQKAVVLAVKDRKEVIIEFKKRFTYEDQF